jgi:hypothetical protein
MILLVDLPVLLQGQRLEQFLPDCTTPGGKGASHCFEEIIEANDYKIIQLDVCKRVFAFQSVHNFLGSYKLIKLYRS